MSYRPKEYGPGHDMTDSMLEKLGLKRVDERASSFLLVLKVMPRNLSSHIWSVCSLTHLCSSRAGCGL